MDTIKTSSTFSIECAFWDGDTRTITLRNPKNDISESDIENLESFIQENKIIIGDRDGSDFRKIIKAAKRNTTTTNLDLS